MILVAATGLLGGTGCRDSSSEGEGHGDGMADTAVKLEYADTIYRMTDTFTVIKRAMCSNMGYEELDYTNENSLSVPMDFLDPTSAFFFISDVDCGSPGGTCGHFIDFIKRDSLLHYKSRFQVCGHIDSIDFSLQTLFYSSVDKKQYMVDFAHPPYKPSLLSVNLIPVLEGDYISDVLNVMSEDLICNDMTTDNPDAIRADLVVKQLEPDMTAAFYTLNFNNVPYSFAFIRKKGQPVKGSAIGGAGHITWQDEGQQFVVRYQKVHEVTQYIYDNGKMFFVKL